MLSYHWCPLFSSLVNLSNKKGEVISFSLSVSYLGVFLFVLIFYVDPTACDFVPVFGNPLGDCFEFFEEVVGVAGVEVAEVPQVVAGVLGIDEVDVDFSVAHNRHLLEEEFGSVTVVVNVEEGVAVNVGGLVVVVADVHAPTQPLEESADFVVDLVADKAESLAEVVGGPLDRGVVGKFLESHILFLFLNTKISKKFGISKFICRKRC